MFERKIESLLVKWKQSSIRKVLILRGARQVGKTSLIRKFGKEKFEELIEINLENQDHKRLIQNVSNVTDFIRRVELFFGCKLEDGKSLLFIDEVQESERVLKLLRFFAEERPKLHVVVAGSLFEAKMKGKWSVPVGRVEYMYLYPLTFFEFLRALGRGDLVDYLESLKIGEDVVNKAQIEALFREYMVVGGMPEAVKSYVASRDMLLVQEVQSRLQTSFVEDVVKYATFSERKYLEVVMRVAPRLAGVLFKYANLGESGYRSREMREAIELLEKVMLVRQVKAVNSLQMPLLVKEKRAKKMIYLDVGMVSYLNKFQLNLMSDRYRGRLMEQVVGQTLVTLGEREKVELYYWNRDRVEGSAEVDFVFVGEKGMMAIEVKSGKKMMMKSMFSLLDKNKNVLPVRIGWEGLRMERYDYRGRQYEILAVPFYLMEAVFA